MTTEDFIDVQITDNSITITTAAEQGAPGVAGVAGDITSAGEATLTNKTIADLSNEVHANLIHEKVKNATGATITAGQPVIFTGFNVGEDAINVGLGDNAVNVSIGLAEKDILSGEFGPMVVSGLLHDVDTSAYTEGTILYVNGIGLLTDVEPTTGYMQPIANVYRSHASNGILHVLAAYPKQDAEDVRYTGTLTAIDVRAALDELDANKSEMTHDHDVDYVKITGDTMTGDLTVQNIATPGLINITSNQSSLITSDSIYKYSGDLYWKGKRLTSHIDRIITGVSVDPVDLNYYYEIGSIAFASIQGTFNIHVVFAGGGGGLTFSYELPVTYNMDYSTKYGLARNAGNWMNLTPTVSTPRHYLINIDDVELQYRASQGTIEFRLVLPSPSNGATGRDLTAHVKIYHSDDFAGAAYTEQTGTGIDATVYDTRECIASGLTGTTLFGNDVKLLETLTVAGDVTSELSPTLDAHLTRKDYVDTVADHIVAPATATSPGTAGNIAFDASYFYICTATDTWVRAPLTTW